MKNRKLMNILSVIVPMAAAVLNAMPNAVKMNWFGGYTTFCSGFSMIPVGYAIWGPMLAGLSAIGVCVLAVFCVFRESAPRKKWMLGLSVFAAVMSVTPLLFGSLTLTGGAVAALMAAEGALVYVTRK